MGQTVCYTSCILSVKSLEKINLINNLAMRQGEQRAGGSSCSVSVKDNSLLKYVGGLMKGGGRGVGGTRMQYDGMTHAKWPIATLPSNPE